jgi:tRNA 2-thiouridine synthesizing protein A
MKEVDARGLSCPLPVLRSKEAIENEKGDILVKVDNASSRDNVERLAKSKDLNVEVQEKEEEYHILIRRGG